ncbi:MAG TPA: hypothetical protein VLV29_08410 [Steroidobacteraceae bacterium]|nr:hypothetical protein [Steroidobacteraceae bacterium]
MEWLISLITGAIGGNVAGAIFKNLSLGPLGNTIAGVVGGGAGAEILRLVLGSGAAGGSVVGNVASSGVGSVVLMLIVGLIKNATAKKA